MCKKCKGKHELGYYCLCECHQVIDRMVIGKGKDKLNETESK